MQSASFRHSPNSPKNIILIGMPGAGKTTIGSALAERLARPFHDSDLVLEQLHQRSIPEIFSSEGEAAFRKMETGVLQDLTQHSGIVLATGGGCITVSENYPILHQNSIVICLMRELEKLPVQGRPIYRNTNVYALYENRAPLYLKFADYLVDNNSTIEETVDKILTILEPEF